MRGAAGLVVLAAFAWVISEDRRAVRWRPVLAGFALQAGLAVLLLRLPAAAVVLHWLDRGADEFQAATEAGTTLVFGYLGGGALPFVAAGQGSAYVLAFRGLPLVLTISAVSALLYHWGVMQRITGGMAWGLRRVMGISGPLALGAAIHIFLGMIEAPLLIRPYLARLSRGELFALMSCGMAGIAGTMMVIYASLLGPVLGDALGNILIASVLSTPAALALSALMIPFGAGEADAAVVERPAHSALDALVQGAMDGVPILAGIVVLLIVAVAGVSLVNDALGLLHVPPLQELAAWPLRPVVWLIGVPWGEAHAAARLLATKTILNEFVAYMGLAGSGTAFSAHTRLILTYAFCGFANLGSVGILIGGLAPMLPAGRRAEAGRLAALSLLSGTMATCMSGAWAGLLTR